MFQILAATNNEHKLEEFKGLLDKIDDFELELKCPADFKNFPEIIEDGDTFEANASKKALESSNFTGLPTFADDSGLAVDALNGAPGIHSARYAGENATNEERINKLLEELKGVDNRKARFVCIIAIAFNGEIIDTFRGECEGHIIDTPRGETGFGYDPVFVPEGYDKTFSELGSEIKDKISHRAKAFEALNEFIEDELETLNDFD